jgi:hypothetical protein
MSGSIEEALALRQTELVKLLGELKQAREAGKRICCQWEAEYATWLKEHEDLGKSLETAQKREVALAGQVRAATLELYSLTGSKKPVEGVAVKEITKVSYEEQSVRTWAIEGKHFDFLCLEKHSFDAWAKAAAKTGIALPPTAKVEKVAQAQISKEL